MAGTALLLAPSPPWEDCPLEEISLPCVCRTAESWEWRETAGHTFVSVMSTEKKKKSDGIDFFFEG